MGLRQPSTIPLNTTTMSPFAEPSALGLPESPGSVAPPGIGALEATELQDHLLTTFNDLERLQRLLDGMCDSLMAHFSRANDLLGGLPGPTKDEVDAIRQELAGAITGLQFQDMGTQLIAHTLKRLRNCADRLAQGALADDEDGAALVEDAPTRPNPVTQDEMDAGSIELF